MRLVLGVPDSGGVQDEATVLAVLGQGAVEQRVVVVGLVDGGREVVQLLWPDALCGRTACYQT
jgi:hypothetical protein